nr:terminal uridylyltransferase 4 isoform X2 [Paramormyrops kingsleyae]
MEEARSPRKVNKSSRAEARGPNGPSSKHVKEATAMKDCSKPAATVGEGRSQPADDARDIGKQGRDHGRGKPRRITGRNSPGERGKGRAGRPEIQPLSQSSNTGAAGKFGFSRDVTAITGAKAEVTPPSQNLDRTSIIVTSVRETSAVSAADPVPEPVDRMTVASEVALTTEQQLGLRQAEERLIRDYIRRLVKRSPEYPNFQYLCTLCSAHIENIQGAHKHIKEKRHKKNIMEKQEEDELRELQPPSPAQLQAVGAVVSDVAQQQGISEEDFLLRQEVMKQMEAVIQQRLSACHLRLYGSCLTRFAFKTSDINIDVVYPSSMTQPDVLIQVLDILKNNPQYTNVESDFHAKVPVVFCRDVSSGLMCKVSAGNDVACLTTNLLAALASKEPKVIPLVLAFRYWAKLCHIDCQTEGGIPSYSFSLMVIFFLQQRKKPILPVYLGSWIDGFNVKLVDEYHLTGVELGQFVAWEHKPSGNGEARGEGKGKAEPKRQAGKKAVSSDGSARSPRASSGMTRLTLSLVQDVPLGQLWLELLRFYTLEFALEEHIISIRLREPLSRESKNWPRRRLAIEDPFALKRNVARSLNSQMVFEYIQERFRTAYKYFACPQSKDGFARQRHRRRSQRDPEGALERPRAPGCTGGDPKLRPRGAEGEEDDSKDEDEDDDGQSEDECDPQGPLSADISELLLSDGEQSSPPPTLAWAESKERADNGALPPERETENGLQESEEEEVREQPDVAPDELYYTFDRMIFTGGKPPTVVCSICKRDGHLKDECPEDFKKIELQPLPPMTELFRGILDHVCRLCYNELSPPPVEQQKREQILAGLERFIRKEYNDKARLCLFGSSKNGFGFRDSDLDICMTLEGHDTAENLNCKDIIEGLAKILKRHAGLRNILPITTAKVPIVKFEHKQSGLEGDISLYNTLAQHNTRMLATYAAIDPRVQYLGYTMKVFAKRCDIGDASRGSLSSYAYILMVLYFLQQRQPPVIPVLQEIFDGTTVPQRMVDGWNAFFFDNIEELKPRLPELGHNGESVGELWLGLLRFYTEEFDFKEHVISIRQRKRLTTFEKQWTSKCIAIEDPFDLSHNLGAGVSRKMTNFIMKAFINGRKLFGTPFLPQPGMEAEYFFDSKVLTDGELAPNDRCCRICGKIGHYMKDCPKRRRMKKKENDKDEEVKEEDREPRERRCFQCGDTGHVRRDCPEYRQLRQRSSGGPVPQITRAMVSSQSIPVPQAGVAAPDRPGRTRQPSECSETRQTPPYSPQSSPFSQASTQSPSSPQAGQVKPPSSLKQPPHPQVQLSLFGFPHSHPSGYHPRLPALGMLQAHQQHHHHHSIPLASASWPIHGPVIQTTSAGPAPHPSPPGLGFPPRPGPPGGNGGGSTGSSGPVGLNDPSIIFAQPAGRPVGLGGPGQEGHWHKQMGPGALVGNGTLGKTDPTYQGQFGKVTQACFSWDHSSVAQHSLSPSWAYRMPQAFLPQGNGGFQQNKPFLSQGTVVPRNPHFPLIPHGSHISLNYIQQKK